MKNLIFSLVAFGVLGCATHSGPPATSAADSTPYVILVSIDAYRYDYTSLFHPSHIESQIKNGVQAQAMLPIFPSKTFPNHYAIITGLYAEHHGIVSNEFYDPQLDATYALSDRKAVSDGRWYGGTPLWVLAEQNHIKSACFFWPGSEAEIQGIRPSYYKNYDANVPNSDRVDQILKWLQLAPEQRPHFLTLYFSAVDTAGHHFGPTSAQTRASVSEVDQMLKRLDDGISKLKLPVNVLVVSDHGMQEIDPKKIEYVDDFAKVSDFTILGDGTQTILYLKKGKDAHLIQRTLAKLNRGHHHFKAYARLKTPAHWHYRNNPRIGDIVLSEEAPNYMQFRSLPPKFLAGNHGYDPQTTKTMWGIFYGWGPALSEGTTLPRFENVNIYPLVAAILRLPIHEAIDGDPNLLKPAMRFRNQ